MENNNTCLYMHTRKSDGIIFYIGIGSKDRPYDVKQRNRVWKYTVKRHQHNIHILAEGLSWERACELEKIYISFYGRKDKKEGKLVNLTDGGDGAKGAIRSEEYKRNASIRLQKPQDNFIKESKNKYGEDSFNYDLVVYNGQHKKIKLICKKHGEIQITPKQHLTRHGCQKCGKEYKSISLKGREFSKEHRMNLSQSMIGKKHSEERKQHQSMLSTGSKNGRAILTEDNVRYIRAHYKPYSKEFGMKQLAEMFGVSVPTIDLITRNKIWTEVV